MRVEWRYQPNRTGKALNKGNEMSASFVVAGSENTAHAAKIALAYALATEICTSMKAARGVALTKVAQNMGIVTGRVTKTQALLATVESIKAADPSFEPRRTLQMALAKC